MPLLLLIAVATPQERPLVPGGGDDGTRTIVTDKRCEPNSSEEVCVVADPNRYRLEKIEPRYVEPAVRAARRLGPGEVALEVEQREFPGAVSNRAMVRFRIPFGKKPK